jgi:hypothetical protein
MNFEKVSVLRRVRQIRTDCSEHKECLMPSVPSMPLRSVL